MAESEQNAQGGSPAGEKTPAESDRGFVSAPTTHDLKPTEREVFLLDILWKWQETSANSRIVLGQPLDS